MSTLTSAYNFVPLHRKVCTPEWSEAVSQDIPLKGALSGTIDLTLTAKTPIFVRGNCNQNEEYEFMQHNGQYCIPGSSLKGTIANVLEILSFGKLQKVNDHRFSQRDWDNSSIYNKLDFTKNKGGWLYFDKTDEKYKIDYNTRNIGRITHEEIDAHFNSNFQRIFGRDFDPKIDGENKSAQKKYKLLKHYNLRIEEGFVGIPDKTNQYAIEIKGENAKTGTLVFSGQPSKREKKNDIWRGKNKEFIFWEPTIKAVTVDDDLMEDFFFAYYEHDSKQRTTDWDHWRKDLANGKRIPVFLQLDSNKNIKHFGLAMLYKLPYHHRISDLIPEAHKSDHNDFVETLFGYSHDQKSIKGRVSFQHAFASKDTEVLPAKTLILGGPKASYYPFYIRQHFHNNNSQKIRGSYKTYNDFAMLAGRKRYPIKRFEETKDVEKSAVSSTFIPLASGTQFRSKIVYHNLLPEELGALLCALTFNEIEHCHHGIGMAKGYGYGTVQMDITLDETLKKKALFAFRCYMESWWLEQNLNGTWSESEQLQELIAMARCTDQTDKLSYMELTNFPKIKKEKKALPKYTHFLNIAPISYPNSYQSEINQCMAAEKERLAAIEQATLQKAKALEQEQQERERIQLIQKGLSSWLSEVASYGSLKEKMNEWIVKRNGEPLSEAADIAVLQTIIVAMRKKKAPKHRKKFFDENKKKDLIHWIGETETQQFLQQYSA